MTRPDGQGTRWDQAQVAPGDVDGIRSAAADLERFALATEITPRSGLTASIMTALEAEPVPAPLVALTAAARLRRPSAMLAALRDAWRVTWSGGRPVGIRLSAAMAVILLLATTGAVGGLAAVGAWTVLQPTPTYPAPAPSVDRVPVVVPPVRPSASPASQASPATPSITVDPAPSGSPAPTASHRPTPTATPTHTPRPTMRPTPRPTAMPTHMPTHHPAPTSMPMPTHHPEPSHGPGHG